MRHQYIQYGNKILTWLSKDSFNKKTIILASMGIIIQFLILKIIYPFPNFMPPDSNSYIEAAFNNQTINIWAIGYSKFLRLFSCIFTSSVALVWCQYLFLEFSILYLIFSLKRIFNLNEYIFVVLLVLNIFNPLIPHISNFVGSDALFTSLSVIWFTQLCWILNKPTKKLLLWHSIVLLSAFMTRYNALYYPIFSIFIITLSSLKFKEKLIGIATVLLFLSAFIARTEYEYYKETGTVQFSAFGGWQIAANALYGYAHTNRDTSSVPPKFLALNTVVNEHMDSLDKVFFFFRPDYTLGVYYLWDAKSPLKVYMNKYWPKNTDSSYFKRWATMAPLYSSYGWYLIYRHPRPYINYYLWPNLIKYYVPPPGFMSLYNIGKDSIDPIVATWFRWKFTRITKHVKSNQINIATNAPIPFAILNFLYAICFIGFITLGYIRNFEYNVRRIIHLGFSLWVANFIFCVFSAPIELRYLLFQIVLVLFFLPFFLYHLLKESHLTSSIFKKGRPNESIYRS